MSLTGYSLNYNGVPLDLLQPSVERTHIYSEDGTTYLFTEWVFDGPFAYNPQAVSFDNTGGAAAGFLPTVSDKNIRETLRVQRGVLIFTVGTDVLLRTPLVGESTDAKNGPTVERCNIVQTMGVKTFIVDLRIVAHVNECTKVLPAARSPLLSHRWKQTETIDHDYYSAIITEGTCVFRSDELSKLAGLPPGTNPSLVLPWARFPDQFRRDLFHPIPNFFKRSPIQVTPHEDGVTYSYRFTDSQKPFRGPSDANCTRIEAYMTGWFSQENFIANPTIDLFGFLPSFKFHVLARAWGNALISRIRLGNNALAVAFAAIGAPNLARSSEYFVSMDLAGKFVQVELTNRQGLTGAILSGLVDPGPSPASQSVAIVNRAFRPIDFAGETVSFDFGPANGGVIAPIIGPADINFLNPIPPPSGDGLSRGTWLGNLVAQALSGGCSIPPKPPQLAGSGALAPPLNPADNTVLRRSLYG